MPQPEIIPQLESLPNHPQVSDPRVAEDFIANDQALLDALNALRNAVVQTLTPLGSIIPFAGAEAPENWLLCDGASYATGSYPSLFELVGTKYGSVDESHFNVPDLRGRTMVGVGTHADVDDLGKADALTLENRTPNHALTSGEIPAHTHGATDAGHTHPSYREFYHPTIGIDPPWEHGAYLNTETLEYYETHVEDDPPAIELGIRTVDVATGNANITVSENTGGGGSHNHGFVTVNYIIRAM